MIRRLVPTTGDTGDFLTEKKDSSVLKEFDAIDSLKTVFLDNTNTGCKVGLVTALRKKLL